MSNISISEIGDRDELKDVKVSVRHPKGHTLRVDASYYPNRLTTEREDADDDEDEAFDEDGRPAAPSWDVSFCAFMHSWNLDGTLLNRRGEPVAGTGPGIIVPLDPYVTQYVPLWFKQGVQNAILEIAFPSLNESRRSRRR